MENQETISRVENELDIERELRSLGLSPKTWPKVLESIKRRLAPPDWEMFSRLHRNFTGYRSESTLLGFYGFVFSHGLQMEINHFRFDRLAAILEDLALELGPGLSILDIGAGAGIVATVVKKRFAPRTYVVQDFCPEARDALKAQGFPVLPLSFSGADGITRTGRSGTGPVSEDPSLPAGGFDRVLCIDSLGEINGDDDGLLAKPEGLDASALADLMEPRYGFAEKLEPWKASLAPDGRLLLWEPFAYPQAMEAVAALLDAKGWQARIISRSPSRNYLELRPMQPSS